MPNIFKRAKKDEVDDEPIMPPPFPLPPRRKWKAIYRSALSTVYVVEAKFKVEHQLTVRIIDAHARDEDGKVMKKQLFKKRPIDEEKHRQAKTEAFILKLFDDDMSGECHFVTTLIGYRLERSRIYIATYECPTNVRQLLENEAKQGKRGFDDDVVWYIMAPIISAVLSLHVKGFMHSDIREEHILLSKAAVPKLTGFRYGKELLDDNDVEVRQQFSEREREMHRKKYLYVAPAMEDTSGFDKRLDVWSLGMTLMSLVNGGLDDEKYASEKSGSDLFSADSGSVKQKEDEIYKSVLGMKKSSQTNNFAKRLLKLKADDRFVLDKAALQDENIEGVMRKWRHRLKLGKPPDEEFRESKKKLKRMIDLQLKYDFVDKELEKERIKREKASKGLGRLLNKVALKPKENKYENEKKAVTNVSSATSTAITNASDQM